MSDYILTHTKIKFYPLKPVRENINIVDIAHSLSLMTRANGHYRHFYSIAQHSISCYKEAKIRGYSPRVQLACLLHDASESYISDLTRPVKRNLPAYFAIEEKLQAVIYEWFGLGDLSEQEQQLIDDVDDTLLHYEFETLMDFPIFEVPPYQAMEHDFSQRDFAGVENEYMAIFERIRCKNGYFRDQGLDNCQAN
jgi:5'-deoxynucleotidase YfbR-like HD superfamily hydrolase